MKLEHQKSNIVIHSHEFNFLSNIIIDMSIEYKENQKIQKMKMKIDQNIDFYNPIFFIINNIKTRTLSNGT